MKKFTILLLSIIFVISIAGSIQFVAADHLEPGQGIFIDDGEVELVTTQGSNYQVYLQTVLRNGDDQLINVTETTESGAYIPHKISDHVFDTLMGKKEIVTIDNIKYEKVQYIFSPTLEQRTIGMYPIFSTVNFEFEMKGNALAQMNEIEDYAIWKIHYCADFADIGHAGLRCIPVFQVLVPTITLEPDDVITQQWTILRELN
tara:strand:+ start:1249 stop:1857 length:609 start_codon:yes stop_codon:yes gene_type:complete